MRPISKLIGSSNTETDKIRHHKEWSKGGADYLSYFTTSKTDALRRELLDPVVLRLIEPNGKSIIDIGCDEGYLDRLLKSSGAARGLGLDVSAGLIERVRKADTDGDYIVHDISSQDNFTDDIFDAAVAHMVLMDVSELTTTYDNIAKRLRARGKFIVSIIVSPYYAGPVGRWRTTTTDEAVSGWCGPRPTPGAVQTTRLASVYRSRSMPH